MVAGRHSLVEAWIASCTGERRVSQRVGEYRAHLLAANLLCLCFGGIGNALGCGVLGSVLGHLVDLGTNREVGGVIPREIDGCQRQSIVVCLHDWRSGIGCALGPNVRVPRHNRIDVGGEALEGIRSLVREDNNGVCLTVRWVAVL